MIGGRNGGIGGRNGSRLMRLAAVLVASQFLALGALQGAEQAPDLRQQIETLARRSGFVVEGAERIEGNSSRAGNGTLDQTIAQLLAGHDFIVIRDRDTIRRVIVVGVRSSKLPVLDDVVDQPARGQQPTIEATVKGRAAEPIQMRFLLDTGASTVVLPRSALGQVGMVSRELEYVDVQTANGTVAGWRGLLEQISVGDAVAENVAVTFLADAQLGGKRLLGMSFLNQFVVTIDIEANTLILESRDD